MTEEPDEERRLLPAEIVHGDGLDVIAGRLVEAARADGVALTGEGGLLPALLSRVLSAGLEAEIGEHLGYERHAAAGRNLAPGTDEHDVRGIFPPDIPVLPLCVGASEQAGTPAMVPTRGR
jgi:hypothetical protein